MGRDELPDGWALRLKETSAGVYSLRAEDASGRAVELSGTEPEALRAEAVRWILQLDAAS